MISNYGPLVRGGRIVEEGTVEEVFDSPSHPYTVGLLQSIPRRGLRKTDRELFTISGNLPQIGDELPTCVYVERCPLATDTCRTEVPPIVDRGESHWTRCHYPDRLHEIPEPVDVTTEHVVGDVEIIGVRGVSKTFQQRSGDIPALVGIELSFSKGETLGLVGESGSGKSTLAKTMLGVYEPDEGGEITLSGRPMAGKANARKEESIKAIQMVFPEPRLSTQQILDRTPHPHQGGVEVDRRVRCRRRYSCCPDRKGDAAFGASPRHAPPPAVRWFEATGGDCSLVRR